MNHLILVDFVLQDEISKELGLDQELQKVAEIRKLSDAQRRDFQERFNNPGEEDRADLKGMATRVRVKFDAELKKLLEPEQYTRLQQLEWQYLGLHAVLNGAMVQALNLTKEQHEKLAAAQSEFAPLNNLDNRPRVSAEDKMKKSLEQSQNWYRRIKEILSEEQMAKYSEVKGTSFNPPIRDFVRPRRFDFTPPSLLIGFAVREPVLKELGIKKDAPEAEALRKVFEAMRQDLRSKDKVGFIGHFNIKYELQVQKVLMPDQFTRLQQITLQYLGISDALDRPEIEKTLDIAPKQRDQMDDLQREASKKKVALLNAPDVPRSESLKKVLELRAELDQKFNALLSQEQQAKFAELTGKPFDVSLLRVQPAAGGVPNQKAEKKN